MLSRVGTSALKTVGKVWKTKLRKSPVHVLKRGQCATCAWCVSLRPTVKCSNIDKFEENGQSRRAGAAYDWKLHHDSTSSHTCFVVSDDLDQNGIATLPQFSYSPNLVRRIFPVPPNNDSPHRTPPWDRSKAQSGFDALLEGRSGTGQLGNVSTVGNSLAEVRRRPRVLFSRILIVCSNIYNKYFFFPNLVSLYFIQTLYMQIISKF